MSKKKQLSKEFQDYEEFIINNKNYSGMPATKNKNGDITWYAPKKTENGMRRIEWIIKKGQSLGMPYNSQTQAGYFAKVMFLIHPTKKKPCSVCGKEMSLYYVYPNANLIKSIKSYFGESVTDCEEIQIIVKNLENKFPERKILSFLNDAFHISSTNIDCAIKDAELKCRLGNSKLLGPGAMSNFPDRLDGYHTYNRCCRSTQDKGRSKANLATYGKDRRAYEYWSDGNIEAANQFMHSSFFSGVSADHVGPISLGFIHDPLVLKRMPSGDNSAKRDRLLYKDILTLIGIEKTNNITVISWFGKLLWNYIKENLTNDTLKLASYQSGLKINEFDYLDMLYIIKESNEIGKQFLEESFIHPKMEYFRFSYSFGGNGQIIKKEQRHITDATNKEYDRYKRICFESLDESKSKENRRVFSLLDAQERNWLSNFAQSLNKSNFELSKLRFEKFQENHQKKILASIFEKAS